MGQWRKGYEIAEALNDGMWVDTIWYYTDCSSKGPFYISRMHKTGRDGVGFSSNIPDLLREENRHFLEKAQALWLLPLLDGVSENSPELEKSILKTYRERNGKSPKSFYWNDETCKLVRRKPKGYSS